MTTATEKVRNVIKNLIEAAATAPLMPVASRSELYGRLHQLDRDFQAVCPQFDVCAFVLEWMLWSASLPDKKKLPFDHCLNTVMEVLMGEDLIGNSQWLLAWYRNAHERRPLLWRRVQYPAAPNPRPYMNRMTPPPLHRNLGYALSDLRRQLTDESFERFVSEWVSGAEDGLPRNEAGETLIFPWTWETWLSDVENECVRWSDSQVGVTDEMLSVVPSDDRGNDESYVKPSLLAFQRLYYCMSDECKDNFPINADKLWWVGDEWRCCECTEASDRGLVTHRTVLDWKRQQFAHNLVVSPDVRTSYGHLEWMVIGDGVKKKHLRTCDDAVTALTDEGADPSVAAAKCESALDGFASQRRYDVTVAMAINQWSMELWTVSFEIDGSGCELKFSLRADCARYLESAYRSETVRQMLFDAWRKALESSLPDDAQFEIE